MVDYDVIVMEEDPLPIKIQRAHASENTMIHSYR